jgi:hypothetical protein
MLVCVTSLPALQSAFMRNLPNFLEHWGNDAKNADEFGRPFSGPFYRRQKERANARDLRFNSMTILLDTILRFLLGQL